MQMKYQMSLQVLHSSTHMKKPRTLALEYLEWHSVTRQHAVTTLTPQHSTQFGTHSSIWITFPMQYNSQQFLQQEFLK